MTYRTKTPRTVRIHKTDDPLDFVCHVLRVTAITELEGHCWFFYQQGGVMTAGFNAIGLTHDFPRVDELADAAEEEEST